MFPARVSDVLSPALIAVPISIGIGILKYRLYDIDRIISLTLAYAIVTGLLVGVYAGLVLLATRVLSFHTRWPVAAPTLAAAASSTRCGGGCSSWWTGGSTAPGMTPTRPRPRSRPA